MGRREFYAWVKQTERDMDGQAADTDTWDDEQNDPGWEAMRRKREEWRGR